MVVGAGLIAILLGQLQPKNESLKNLKRDMKYSAPLRLVVEGYLTLNLATFLQCRVLDDPGVWAIIAVIACFGVLGVLVFIYFLIITRVTRVP